ncbi:MAG TPA: AMP-binding protein, partial [Acetobacteraceae bacterium]|nr:AMP-binding protein [Acetobacteraceae bacterium]
MTAYHADTVGRLLAAGHQDAPAIAAPGRPALTYVGLRALAARTMASLNAMGIGRGDRVAMVLPNGPEMAALFVTAACCATTAPLNPAYKADEFEFYLSDLNASALI